jgi:uncharacterized protein YkwD
VSLLRSHHAFGAVLAGLALCIGFTAASPRATADRPAAAATTPAQHPAAPASAAPTGDSAPSAKQPPSAADHGKVVLAADRRSSYHVPAPNAPAGQPGTDRSAGNHTSTPAEHSAAPATRHSTPKHKTVRSSSGYSVSSYAYAVLRQLNAERHAHGLPSLTMNSQLISSAHKHNLAMASHDLMSHQVPGEAYFADRILAAGYNYSWAGENVGWNANISTAGVLQLETMMYDEGPGGGHYENIVNKHYTNVGIDVWVDTVHHKVWLTEDFGSR